MKNRLFALLGILLLNSMISFAQNEDMTSYEKARYELAEQTMKKIIEKSSLGDKMAISVGYNKIKEDAEDVFEQTRKTEDFICVLCGISSLFTSEADYLSRSFFAEEQYKGEMINYFSGIGEWYSNERKIIESGKTEADTKRELERNNRRLGQTRIIAIVSRAFSEWAQKGELEKTSEYNARISSLGSHVLDSLCFVAINNHWRDGRLFSIKKGKYNADDESLQVIITASGIDGNEITSVSGSLPITIDEYKEFDFPVNRIAKDLSWAYDMYEIDNVLFPSSMKLCVHGRFYNVTFGDGQNFEISGNQLKGLSEELRSLVSSYKFNYPSYANNITTGLEVKKKVMQLYKGFSKMLQQHVLDVQGGLNYEYDIREFCDYREFMDLEKASNILDGYVDKCTRSFYNSSIGNLEGWLIEAFPYAIIKEKLSKETDKEVVSCITELAAKEFIKYAPTIEKRDFQSPGNRAVHFLVHGFEESSSYRSISMRKLCYQDEIIREIISASPFLSKELQKYQKKYEKEHPEYQSKRSNPDYKHMIDETFYSCFIKSILYNRFIY